METPATMAARRKETRATAEADRVARFVWAWLALGLGALTLASSCSSNEEPPPLVCIDGGIDLACTPAYEPTFANVFAQTLQPRCGYGGAACHTVSGRQGGLVFAVADEAHDTLLKQYAVRPGRPECSPAVQRMLATDSLVRMPPGGGLEDEHKCAIAQWIAAGAPR